jgi:hypothetical protein
LSQYSAPPVIYPLGRSRFLAFALFTIWLTGVALTCVWAFAAGPADHTPWLGLVASAIAGALAWTGWRRSPVGQLHWDGQVWAWQSSGYQGKTSLAPPQVSIDLQSCLLLKLLNPAGAAWWLWAERSSAPARWLDLRRAVHARGHPQGSVSGEPIDLKRPRP